MIDILNSLQEINISCKDVAFKIFDLSLTTYNMMISLFMFAISRKVYLINNNKGIAAHNSIVLCLIN